MQAKKMKHFIPSRLTTIGLICITALSSQAGFNYEMRKSVVASGGESAGGQYRVQSAIGQHITTQSASTNYQLNAGFYQQNRDLIFFNEFESNQ